MSTAIEFNHISKQYRLGLVSTRTLSHDLNRWWTMNVLRKEDPYLKIGETNDRSTKGNSEYVWALRDIDFKIEQGDVVGIIGKNGAGKSTLLKLLSRVTAPTTGTIRAKGRIASLLEVGTGFHPEMTGRENIFMNGAIMGMTKQEIRAKLDEIVDFSGCERYLDTPVKRYSSGMMVRLGFAVAAHLDPEILVVDEVLAVGDAEFQKKAIGKMQDVSRGEGRTVLFVSHNMASVQNLCHSGVVLRDGQVAFRGGVSEAIDYYMTSSVSSNCLLDLKERAMLLSKQKAAYITDVVVVDVNGYKVDNVLSGDLVDIQISYRSSLGKRLEINVGIYNAMGDKIMHLSSKYSSKDIMQYPPENGVITFHFDKCPFPEGMYFLNVTLWSGMERIDAIQNVLQLNVSAGDFYHCGTIPSAADSKILLDYKMSLTAL